METFSVQVFPRHRGEFWVNTSTVSSTHSHFFFYCCFLCSELLVLLLLWSLSVAHIYKDSRIHGHNQDEKQFRTDRENLVRFDRLSVSTRRKQQSSFCCSPLFFFYKLTDFFEGQVNLVVLLFFLFWWFSLWRSSCESDLLSKVSCLVLKFCFLTYYCNIRHMLLYLHRNEHVQENLTYSISNSHGTLRWLMNTQNEVMRFWGIPPRRSSSWHLQCKTSSHSTSYCDIFLKLTVFLLAVVQKTRTVTGSLKLIHSEQQKREENVCWVHLHKEHIICSQRILHCK
jgi:hypothetical protein